MNPAKSTATNKRTTTARGGSEEHDFGAEEDNKAATKSSWRDTLKVHPAADEFRMFNGDEREDLLADIRRNGCFTTRSRVRRIRHGLRSSAPFSSANPTRVSHHHGGRSRRRCRGSYSDRIRVRATSQYMSRWSAKYLNSQSSSRQSSFTACTTPYSISSTGDQNV